MKDRMNVENSNSKLYRPHSPWYFTPSKNKKNLIVFWNKGAFKFELNFSFSSEIQIRHRGRVGQFLEIRECRLVSFPTWQSSVIYSVKK